MASQTPDPAIVAWIGTLTAIGGFFLAFGRRLWRFVRRVVDVAEYGARLEALDRRVTKVESDMTTQLEAFKKAVDLRLTQHEQQTHEEVRQVKAEVRTIGENMARGEDLKRVDGKIDSLLEALATRNMH